MAAKKTKVIWTGIVERASIERKDLFYDDLARYSPNTERCQYVLDVALRLDDGRTVYFNTPPARMLVSSAISCAVVTYDIGEEASKWLREEGDRRVATQEQSNDNRLVALVKVGDRIAVTGHVKAEKVSKAGRPYVVLNRVRRQEG